MHSQNTDWHKDLFNAGHVSAGIPTGFGTTQQQIAAHHGAMTCYPATQLN